MKTYTRFQLSELKGRFFDWIAAQYEHHWEFLPDTYDTIDQADFDESTFEVTLTLDTGAKIAYPCGAYEPRMVVDGPHDPDEYFFIAEWILDLEDVRPL